MEKVILSYQALQDCVQAACQALLGSVSHRTLLHAPNWRTDVLLDAYTHNPRILQINDDLLCHLDIAMFICQINKSPALDAHDILKNLT